MEELKNITKDLPKDNQGRFLKGFRYSISTEFKVGSHWRKEKPFWNKNWLYNEYVVLQRSSFEIAQQFNVTDGAILFWLRKHGIKPRDMVTIRKIKKWSTPTGKLNPMFGKRGKNNPNWRGGQNERVGHKYEKWRRSVLKRDSEVCRLCHDVNSLQAHHIKRFALFPKLRWVVSNGITLCKECHKKFRGKEELYEEEFQFIVSIPTLLIKYV